MLKKNGDIESFDKSWLKSKESYYTHWTREEPENQVQFAFRNHWILMQEIMESNLFNKGKRCLEVGCGRGSISAYFSDAGYECTLIDTSEYVLKIAKEIFNKYGLKGKFKVGNVNKLPFEDNLFDIVFSIGLLEHFEDIEPPIKEQIRIIDKEGVFMAYIVPKYTDNIQKEYDWINQILKGYVVERKELKQPQKQKIYRSDYDSKKYIKVLKKFNLHGIQASGVYPLPMISHSIEFPFTLMPKKSEKILVSHFQKLLEKKRKKTEKNPWLCKEKYGQAFFIWGFRK